jgi:diguanylate cyclase (GGDEF)-like protein
MDILVWYAGDEFVAIMPMASSSMAAMVGERIRSAVAAQKFAVRTGKVVQLGISTGVACFPDDGETTEELLTAAGGKMQSDKRSRKTLLTLANAPVDNIDAFR